MRLRKVIHPIALFVLLLCLLMPAAAFADDFKKEPVTVSLTDSADNSGNPFAVIAAAPAVHHRKVTFHVTNHSLRPLRHELIIIKSDLASGALPLLDGRVDESQVEIVARTPLLEGSALSATLTEVLKKGNYVLICNVGTHYARGMHAGFHVGQDNEHDEALTAN